MTDIDALIADMTLAEKLAQLGCVWSTQLVDDSGFSDEAAHRLLANGTGQVTRIAASTGLRPQGLAVFANEIQRFLVEETRLGIPAIIHEESVAGFCARDAVQFPQGIGLAATWNRELVHEVADHIRREMLAVGARQSLAPVLDIARDPRWGRVEETYGEDPVLAGELGVAYVIGLQGSGELARPEPIDPDADAAGPATLEPRARDGVIATGKHFLGYGLPEGGRNHGPVQMGSRELREVFAEPFAAAIRDAGLSSVMNSYSSVDGLPCAGSAMILIELLRGELGFTGTVVADYFAVDLLRTFHRIAPTKGVAAAKALLAGMDVELPALDCYAELPPLVEAGIVPEPIVDAAVRRVLAQKVALGLFEDPFVDSDAAPAAFGTPGGRSLARRAAVESIVLLTNDGTVPIDPTTPGRTVAVVGPAADDVRLLQGDYHYPAHLEIIYGDAVDDAGLLPQAGGAFAPGPHYPPSTTPLAGITAALEDSGATVLHEPGCAITGDDASGIPAAVESAARADLVVCCLGGRSGLVLDSTVGEARDAVDLDPTGPQLELLRAVAATGTPVVTVVVSGRVHTLAEVEALSAATLLAWVPGQEGGAAIADVLFGVEPPSGRLPVSLPRHVGQLPVHYNHRAGGGASAFWGDYTDSPASPLHPFGFGLSTTSCSWSELEVRAGSTTTPTSISVTVSNTGDRDGVEVVPLFVHDESASVARPDRQLVGFARVALPVGASRRVTFTLHPSRLAFFDDSFDFACEPGAFRAEVGGWAGAPARTATFDLPGEVQEYRQVQVVATGVAVDEV